jgi:secondary thiamine-phosphate synthase enzyme
MNVYQEELQVSSSKRTEVIEITRDVEKIVEKSDIKNGICQIFLTHATAGLILQETESGLIRDIEKGIKKLFPQGAGYEHDKIDDNADSHLASGFIGQSRSIPIKNGQMVRGTWQNILVLELDGPRSRRTVFVTIIGEKS